MTIEDKLFKVKYISDIESHLKPDLKMCAECKSKICTKICPAKVYEWDTINNTLIINYENCLECGACKIACEKKCINWKYPKGINGVTYKYG